MKYEKVNINGEIIHNIQKETFYSTFIECPR